MSGPASGISSLHHQYQNPMGAPMASSASSSVFSPSSINPLEWSIAHVCRWLQTLQPASIAHNYTSKFREQGIEGDVLLYLGADALRELGVGSVGHRLVLLRAIYELKRKWNIEVDPDSWQPDVAPEGKGVERLALPSTIANVASIDLVRALHERDERVWVLEHEIARLVDWLRQCTDETMTGPSSSFKLVEPLRPYLPSSKAHSSLPFPGLSRDEHTASTLRSYGSGGTLGSVGTIVNGSMNSAAFGSDVRDGDDPRPPSRGMRSVMGSSLGRAGSLVDREREKIQSPFGIPGSSSGFSPTNSNTPSATPTNAHPPTSFSEDASKGPASATVALGQGLGPDTSLVGSSGSSAANGFSKSRLASDSVSQSGTNTASGTADTPYKSFRVTLDDPCYKVLPAALKKYKINDDWRQYALFICYGTTERCLSYDEKPLLLFQKLKENKQSPVFMLRHIRDVKSPIAIANAKAAARKLPSAPISGGEASRKDLSPTTNAAGAEGGGKVASAVAKFNKTGSREASDASLGSTSKSSMSQSADSIVVDSTPGQPRITGPASQLPTVRDGSGGASSGDISTDQNLTSRVASIASTNDTYAISIYPYVSEREDEFDVSVGDTFVVKSKAKGWWVVQRDMRATGEAHIEGVIYEADGTPKNGGEICSGWVPAGCLLETRKPLASLVSIPDSLRTASPTSPTTPLASTSLLDGAKRSGQTSSGAAPTSFGSTNSTLTAYMAGVPIPPSLISSTSTEGILLMDYTDDDEGLRLKKDQRLRVFKRYNHWSYCVEESPGHARAWLPSWYIGKVRDSSSSALRGTQGSSGHTGTGRNQYGSKAPGNRSGAPIVQGSKSADELGLLPRSGGSGSGSASGDHLVDSALSSTPLGTPLADRTLPSFSHSLFSGTPGGGNAASTASSTPTAATGPGLSTSTSQSRSNSPLSLRNRAPASFATSATAASQG